MPSTRKRPAPSKSTNKSTVSRPRKGAPSDAPDPVVQKLEATNSLAEAFPFNRNKPAEFGEGTTKAKPGATADAVDSSVTGSTLREETTKSAKAGGRAPEGFNPGNVPLEAVRVDSVGQTLTTNFGAPVGDNQNLLKAGPRGPALLEDFILREKITHFDHERIPERIVHARGSGAHGFFECYQSMEKYTRASFLNAKGKRTPVFVRSRPLRASAVRSTRRGMSAASPPSSIRTKATSTSLATTFPCSSSRTR